MNLEKRPLQLIEKCLQSLSVPLYLLDEQGKCILPKNSEFSTDGMILHPMDTTPAMSIAVPANAPAAKDLLNLADALITDLLSANRSINTAADVYRKTLQQELTGAELIACANDHRIPTDKDRCVLLFQLQKTETTSAYEQLSSFVPLSDSDALVEMNRHTVALIKDMGGIEGVEDLRQFASAVQETLMEESVKPQQMIIGIGEERHSLAQLPESYEAARRAVEVGSTFHPTETVFVYRLLMLERFLTHVSRDRALFYHSLLFNRKTAKLFNEEMLQTIEMFFDKDLNLSDTARQLFIHRNTLVYRLDKVQRLTGLDLRHFDDAVTFKILYELKNGGQNDHV